MPQTKDFKKKANTEHNHEQDAASEESRPKRRPGREQPEASEAEVKVVDVEEGVRHEQKAPSAAASESTSTSFEAEPEAPKVEIRFFGSELIRAKLPKPFEVVEAVATDWVHGGDFSKLPIDHPLAQFAAQKGLQKAKEVEKKVLESPVTEKVAMQVLTAGMKAQGYIDQLRNKLKDKK